MIYVADTESVKTNIYSVSAHADVTVVLVSQMEHFDKWKHDITK